MLQENPVTVLAIGGAISGISENGCAFLQNNNAFQINESFTYNYETNAQHNTINGVKRIYIDTGPLYHLGSLLIESFFKMVDFLKEWENGFNAFFIVKNHQDSRFLSVLEKSITLINQLFSDENFWNQAGLIFTRYFGPKYRNESSEKAIRKKILSIIKQTPEKNEINHEIPFFFVETKEWDSDEHTKKEYQKIFDFAYKNKPIQTYKRFTTYNDEFIISKSDINNDQYDMLVLFRPKSEIVRIPPFIKVICSYAFEFCTTLKKIEFPINSEIREIRKFAFHVTSIESIILPPSLVHLYEKSFVCNRLQIVEIDENSEIESFDKRYFSSFHNNIFVMIPSQKI